MSMCGSSESRGARDGAREQLEETASSLMRAGSCSKSSSLSSHFGGGDMKLAERGGGACDTGDHIQNQGGGGGGDCDREIVEKRSKRFEEELI